MPAKRSQSKTRAVSKSPKKSPPAPAGNKKKQPVVQERRKKRDPEPQPPSSSEDEQEEVQDDEFEQEDASDGGSDDDSESGDDKGKKNTPFTDKNAAWLKPKKKKLLASSDEESDDNEDEEGGDNDDDDDDEELEIERETRMLDEELELEKEEAEEEMRLTISQNTAIYHLPTSDEVERDTDRVVPPSEIRSHIESILEVLADFKKRREQGRSRVEYVDQLGIFIAEMYGYLPERTDRILSDDAWTCRDTGICGCFRQEPTFGDSNQHS
jgi:ribosomal RNA methyltransferase Nop2